MRLRVATVLAALALLVILIQSLVMVWLIDRKEEEFIDSQLNDQIAYSMEVWRKSPDLAFPNTPAMWLYRIGHGQPPANVPPFLAKLQVGNHEVFLGSKEYHVAVREDDQARYILAYDVEDHEDRLDELIFVTVLGACGLGLLTLLAGYGLAGRLTRRLEVLADKVEKESPDRLREPGMERELGALADALDQYRTRQGEMLERERAFAANLSHELRTPLTGIRTDAELLASLPDLPEAVERRATRIVASVDRINALASSLLLLAREARPGAAAEILLQPAIVSIWESVQLASPQVVEFILDVPESAVIIGDPVFFDLVLRNVLDNALRYSDEGRIVCRLNGSRLSVTDSGPGFSAGELEQVFNRFFVGQRGTNGLGLALVRHVCLASGWRVSARNAPAGGGELTIDFGRLLADDGITDSSQIAH